MSIYEAFINFLQKEYKLPKPLKGQKIVRPEKIIDVPKKVPYGDVSSESPSGKSYAARSWGENPFAKGGVGSGRKAGAGSKLAPKTGSIKRAISRYYAHRTPALHNKIVEAFQSKEGKKVKPSDTASYLSTLKNPLD